MVMRYRLKVFFDDALSLAHGLKCQFLIGHACLLPQNRPYEFKSLIETKWFDGKTHGRPALDRLPRLSANARRHRGPRQAWAVARQIDPTQRISTVIQRWHFRRPKDIQLYAEAFRIAGMAE